MKDHMFCMNATCELVDGSRVSEVTGWVLNNQIVYKDSSGAELLGDRAIKSIISRHWIRCLEQITYIHRHMEVKK
jgi:hypothetical protein